MRYWKDEIETDLFCDNMHNATLANATSGSITNSGAATVPSTSRYVRSLYWALATMSSLGYGAAPVAITDAEFVFAIMCQITGACMYAAIFGNVRRTVASIP